MNFLITCNSLNLSGTSTYTYTLAVELRRKGHEVDVFTCFEEEIAVELRKNGIFVSSRIDDFINKKYYCIIAQHNILALIVRGIIKDAPMIFISHGVRPFLEQPPSQDINIYKYIAVSEEIKKHLPINNVSLEKITVIKNFIDIKRFYPIRKINHIPKRALFISNHRDREPYIIIKKACSSLGIKLNRIGRGKKFFQTENYINDVDIVISLGRGILEAMSCGRVVLVYDYAGGDGIVTKGNIDLISACNFSGKRFKREFSPHDLVQEIKKYDCSMGEINRNIIKKDYNSAVEVGKIISLCKKAQEQFTYKNINVPYKELYYSYGEINRKFKKNSITKTLLNLLKLGLNILTQQSD